MKRSNRHLFLVFILATTCASLLGAALFAARPTASSAPAPAPAPPVPAPVLQKLPPDRLTEKIDDTGDVQAEDAEARISTPPPHYEDTLFEVTCLRAKVADVDLQRRAIKGVLSRRSYTEQSFASAADRHKDNPGLTARLTTRMNVCTYESALKSAIDVGALSKTDFALRNPLFVLKPKRTEDIGRLDFSELRFDRGEVLGRVSYDHPGQHRVRRRLEYLRGRFVPSSRIPGGSLRLDVKRGSDRYIEVRASVNGHGHIKGAATTFDHDGSSLDRIPLTGFLNPWPLDLER